MGHRTANQSPSSLASEGEVPASLSHPKAEVALRQPNWVRLMSSSEMCLIMAENKLWGG